MTTDWDFCTNTQTAELVPGANQPQITVSPLSEFVLGEMASIQRLESPLTGRISYRVQVRVKGWRSESETFPNRQEAIRWAASREAAIREGRHFPHARALRTSFCELAQRYRDTVFKDLKVSGKMTRARHISWWVERFGSMTLAEITPDRIAEARDALAAETWSRATTDKAIHGCIPAQREYQRAGATVNRYLATLSHMFTTAVREWRLIDRNPVRDVSKKKEARGRTRFLSDSERTALLTACANSAWAGLCPLVLLAISTGARRGELIRLQWTDVSLDPPSPRALVRETKNGESRVLPLVGRSLETLTKLRSREGDRSRFVFPAPSGADRPYEWFDAHWHAALTAAGIEDFRFHDLRHTCASYLASQGASLLEIADVLGHRTMSMVKRYSHLAQGHKVAVIEKMAKQRNL
jgi:integrase